MCACVCVRTCLRGLHACLALQMKLCMNTLISAPLGWRGAWLWISILHSSLFAPPDAPHDTKANQLSVCVSVYQEAARLKRGSFFHPASLPQGHWGKVCWMSCIKLETMIVCNRCLRQQNIFLSLYVSKQVWMSISRNPYVMRGKMTWQKVIAKVRMHVHLLTR